MLQYDLLEKIATLLQQLPGEGITFPPPIIGIPAPVRESRQGPVFSQDAVGIWAIERTQGNALLVPAWPLPPTVPLFRAIWPQLLRFDGLFVSTYAHTDQEHWYDRWLASSEATSAQKWIVDGELAFIQLAAMLGMPILGVGDGAEKLNVALGGNLRQEVQERKGRKKRALALPPPDHWPHQVFNVRKYTRLAAVFEQHSLPGTIPITPQRPIEHLAQGLVRSADAEDGSVVAFERADHFFAMGFLGRIDWMLEECAPVFASFIHACQEYAEVRQQIDIESLRDEICTYLTAQVAAQCPLLLPVKPAMRRKRSAMVLGPMPTTTPLNETDEPGGLPESHTAYEQFSASVLEDVGVVFAGNGPLKRENHVPRLDELKKYRRNQLRKAGVRR